MKRWLIGFSVILFYVGNAQQTASFSTIDWKVQNMEAPTPDSLANLITANYTLELEKIRAIYSWIARHIVYNTSIFNPKTAAYKYSPDPLDTAAVWPSGDEMIARKVMRRGTAVCDGYAKLFKVLCSYAGVQAEVIQGYGRVYGMGNKKFQTNHTWNAVKIDSTWHLLDVTWASGHLNFGNEFISQQNDFYFLTPPSSFINDHYPEELRWTLLSNPPTLAEFKKAPFRSKNFYKYGVDTYYPTQGILEVSIGDTLNFSLQVKDMARAKRTGGDPFIDTTSYNLWPLSSFVKPLREKGNSVVYRHVIQPGTDWLHLLYNDDVIIHYRIRLMEKFVKNDN